MGRLGEIGQRRGLLHILVYINAVCVGALLVDTFRDGRVEWWVTIPITAGSVFFLLLSLRPKKPQDSSKTNDPSHR